MSDPAALTRIAQEAPTDLAMETACQAADRRRRCDPCVLERRAKRFWGLPRVTTGTESPQVIL